MYQVGHPGLKIGWQQWGGFKMSSPDSFLGLRYHEHGAPEEVLRSEISSLGACGQGEAIIKMEAATIHPSDVGLINGSYGSLKELPATAGREGVGIIYSVGPGVDEKLIGRPVTLSGFAGVWQEFSKEKIEDLIYLPSLVPLDQLSVSVLNPFTAWRLLNDFEYLKPGDFIVQNAGNSAVGISVIQFAATMGIRCISFVRSQETKEKLSAFTEEDVFIDQDDAIKHVESTTKGKKCVLALNSVGGKSSLRLARCLQDGGVHVTFGAMDGTPVRFPTRNLIFNDIRFVGFWLDRWKEKKTISEIRNSLEDVLQPLALNKIKYPIDSVYELKDFKNALARNAKSRFGKVLLVREGSDLLNLKDQGDE